MSNNQRIAWNGQRSNRIGEKVSDQSMWFIEYQLRLRIPATNERLKITLNKVALTDW